MPDIDKDCPFFPGKTKNIQKWPGITSGISQARLAMKTIYTAILVFLLHSGQAQDMTQHITPCEAGSIKRSLSSRMPDTVRIEKLFKLAYFHILKPGEDRTDLDSAEIYLDRVMRLINPRSAKTGQGRLLVAQSHLLRERGQRQGGRQMIQKAIRMLGNGRDKKNLGLAYYELSQYYNYTDPADMVEKLRYVQMAVWQFRQSGSLGLKAYSLKMLADLHNFNGQGEKALPEAIASLEAYQAAGEQQLQGVYELIGSIYFGKGDYVRALNYRLKALKTAVLFKDTTMQFCQINNGIGMTFMRLKDYPKAITYLKSAMPVAQRINDRGTVISLSFNIAESYLSQGKVNDALAFLHTVPGKYIRIKDISTDFAIALIHLEIYTALKDFPKGVGYSKQLSNVAELPQMSNSYRNYIYTALIKFYTVTRRYKAATSYLMRNKRLLTQLKDPSGMARNYKAWFRLDTMQRDYKAAVKHLLLRNKLKDSLSVENQKVDIQRVTSFYETAQRENAIKLLKARSKLQQIQLQHAESAKRWFLSFAFMLLFLLVILIHRYLIKRRVNKVLKDQYVKTSLVNQNLVEEKTGLIAEKDDLLTQKQWLLSEIHHRVRNNLHTVVSLLESQAVFLRNDALKAIEKSQHRIYAMSLIHQKIYSDEHVKAIDISGFIPELVRYLRDSHHVNQKIQFELDLDPVKISVTQAIPLALIINEVITNAIVHAFSKKSSGNISVSMHRAGNLVTLVIADNGTGINPDKKSMPSGSLGLVLINGLSGDMNAEIEIKNDHGTRVTLVFPAEQVSEREGGN